MREAGGDALLEDTLDAGVGRPDAIRDRDPSRIGRFVVLERIGTGGMGAVFAAFDQQLDRKVALKLLHPEQSEARQRLLREAQAMAKLSHPNVVPVYEVGTHDRYVFLAMELVRGVTLRKWFDARPRRLEEIVDVFVQAGRGLAAAHVAGLVHRDFKPENVLVGDDGRVRVVDFGLARPGNKSRRLRRTAIPGSIPRQDELATELTRDGQLVGTPAYLAPEVYDGMTADARSDQFSFCVALFETLYGKRPFSGATLGELSAAVLRGQLATMAGGPVGAERLRKVLARGLDPDPARRFSDMEALLDAIRPPKRRRLAWVPVAGVAITAVPLAVWLGTRDTTGLPACDDTPTPVAERLTADARTELAERFTAKLEPGAARTAIAAIDDYASAWTDARQQACATEPDADPEAMQRVASERACLDSRGRELVALLDAIAGADAELLGGTHRAVLALHPPSRCQDARFATALLPAPDDDDLLRAAMAIRLRLGLAWALNDLGRPADAHRVARETRLAAGDVADRSLQAHALFVLSYMTWGTGRTAEANTVAEEALIAAEAASDEHRRGLALAWLAIIALLDGRMEAAADHKRRADAVFESCGADEELEAWLAFYDGTSPDTPQDERLAAMARALELYTRIAGPQSQEVVGTQHNLGDALVFLGRLDEAFAHLDERRRTLEGLYGPTSSHLLFEYISLAGVRLQQGDHEDARRWNAKAEAVAQAHGDDAHWVWVEVLAQRAQLEEATGQYAAALEAYDAALRHATAGIDDPDRVAKLRIGKGLALVALGRGRDAMRAFEGAEAGLAEKFNRKELREHALYGALVEGWTWAAIDAGEFVGAQEIAERLPAERRAGAGWMYLDARLSAPEGTPDPERVQAAVAALDGEPAKTRIAADLFAAARAWLTR